MGRPMTPEAMALREEVMAAVRSELDQGRKPDRNAIARQFQDRGAMSTLLRWVDQALVAVHHNPAVAPETGSGDPAEHPAPVMVAAAPGSGDRPDGDFSEPAEPNAGPGDLRDAGYGEQRYGGNRHTLGDCGEPESPVSVGPETEGTIVVALSPAELRRLDQWRRFRMDQPDRGAAARQLIMAGFRSA
jgi:hypothetical protein